MRRRLLVVLLTAMWGLSAAAAEDPRVVEGIRLYQNAKLIDARGLLGSAVDDPNLPEADQAEARLYLAAAYHALGDLSAARAQLVILFDRHPGVEVSPAVFVPGMVELAEQVRDELASRPVALPAGSGEGETGGESGTAAGGQTGTDTSAGGSGETDSGGETPTTETGGTSGDTTGTGTTVASAAGASGTGGPSGAEGPAGGSEGTGQATRPRSGPTGTVALWGVGEVLGRSVGFGASLTLGWQGAELSPRVLFGENIGVGLEVGYAFLDARVTPRLLVRGTYFPGVGWGGGQALGLRVRVGGGLVITGDFGVELFSVPSGYRDLGLVGTLGVGWEVFGR